MEVFITTICHQSWNRLGNKVQERSHTCAIKEARLALRGAAGLYMFCNISKRTLQRWFDGSSTSNSQGDGITGWYGPLAVGTGLSPSINSHVAFVLPAQGSGVRVIAVTIHLIGHAFPSKDRGPQAPIVTLTCRLGPSLQTLCGDLLAADLYGHCCDSSSGPCTRCASPKRDIP